MFRLTEQIKLPPRRILTLDSITKAGPDAEGAVAVAASHGGIYAAHAASAAGVVGVILSDAGIGLDRAGIAGLDYLDIYSLPCAAIDYRSARIGDGADCMTRGVISHANRTAMALGVTAGMRAAQAAGLMATATLSISTPPPIGQESRSSIVVDGALRAVWLADSASLIEPADAGSVVVTGSHGGLLGGVPGTAAKANVFAAIYNDAGIGADSAGISRLPALDPRGISAATVSHQSARIGDAISTFESGVISAVNATATQQGAHVGMTARAFVRLMACTR